MLEVYLHDLGTVRLKPNKSKAAISTITQFHFFKLILPFISVFFLYVIQVHCFCSEIFHHNIHESNSVTGLTEQRKHTPPLLPTSPLSHTFHIYPSFMLPGWRTESFQGQYPKTSLPYHSFQDSLQTAKSFSRKNRQGVTLKCFLVESLGLCYMQVSSDPGQTLYFPDMVSETQNRLIMLKSPLLPPSSTLQHCIFIDT